MSIGHVGALLAAIAPRVTTKDGGTSNAPYWLKMASNDTLGLLLLVCLLFLPWILTWKSNPWQSGRYGDLPPGYLVPEADSSIPYGRYSGLGPQSYIHSDSRILEDINKRLTQHGAIDASDIEVGVHFGKVTLRGTVANRQAKVFSEEVAESVLGVKDVRNELGVGKLSTSSLSSGPSSGAKAA
jgi:hypothetical protein